MPGQEELAIRAIATGGVRILNDEIANYLDPAVIDAVTAREQKELQRRERLYRGERPGPEIGGRVVILVDDGLATGATMLAAATALGRMGPSKLVVAVPVAPAEICDEVRSRADEVVCAVTPRPFRAVGQWYADFSQTDDDEVRELLRKAACRREDPSPLLS
jgi:predicted phosphoribosyltransferase